MRTMAPAMRGAAPFRRHTAGLSTRCPQIIGTAGCHRPTVRSPVLLRKPAPWRNQPTRNLIEILSLVLFIAYGQANAATLYVDAARKSDPANNRFASISQALPNLKTGDTLLIADGIYRDSIDLRKTQLRRDSGGSAVTRIEAAPGARPIVMGSEIVTGWRRVSGDVFAKDRWTFNSQQVFIDGAPLRQIGGQIFGDFPANAKHPMASLHRSQGGIWPGRTGDSVDDMVVDSFYYDSKEKVLYVKTNVDLNKASTVEVSTRPYLVFGKDIDGVEIRGLRFAHANTTAVSQSGAVTLIGNRLVLDDLFIEHVDGAGVDVTGNDNVVIRSTANRCGTVGMKVRGRNARVVDNETSFNNTRAFNKWWEAGGAKFVGAGGLQDSEVSGHRAFANNGDGLWFDWHNDNNRIHRNVSAYNAGMGIHYEASRNALIHDNYVFGNAQRGIYLPNSSHSVVAHNLVAANGMEGVVIVDERRAAQSGKLELLPIRNLVAANVFAWNGKAALVLPLTAEDNRADGNAYVGEDAPHFSLGWPTRERPLINGLDAWQTDSGQDTHSQSIRQAQSPAIRKQLQDRSTRAKSDRSAWTSLLNATAAVRAPTIAGVDKLAFRSGESIGPAL